jgi:YD repeat-containing protein
MRDYASDGTLTARGDGQTLGFDARGRLVTATDSGGLAAWQYLFDAEGRRMAKIDLGLGQASTRTSYSGN